MTPHDCNTLVREFGIVRLFAASEDAGPYVIRVGGVIVGAFGFTRGYEDASDFVDQNSHHQQLTAYTLARTAFEAVTLYAESDDPSALRQIARSACRASRKLWSVLGYGTTEAIRETHAKLVGDDAAKVAAQLAARRGERCPNRVELELIRRPGNALNVEIGQGCDRCKLKPPENWGSGSPSVMRWLLSGGSPMVLGRCTPECCPTDEGN